ncbi:Aste57867_5750 [Aphanomyces stellatus]|uniref:Aste57867_3249 protein n=1 Tax=Aphanomyces stellatus TaxID=120398 RepID=A0A485K9Z8_9STRA|nr:hypothetical protein As57867_005736 [Aphanomyces stellatus]KAF0709811.1 hypothetical protein As57867_005734 [Aphanomyces stellatus]KAF0715681.1 hypothetical protein As57867_003239 [Aphanomyces stellatus]VFT80422.1 Aste57867_3249 [Aphanomyces stellatus]VFT82779.1 Aste57867_5748 [Aphanomyces stellatus]
MGNLPSYISKEVTAVGDLLHFKADASKALVACRAKYGDAFLVQSSFIETKIAGLCGPRALAQFNELVASGAIVKSGALPPSLIGLIGPVMSTLENDSHDKRKAALLHALTPVQLARYKPVIRRIVQAEHARWVTLAGSTISLATLSKVMVYQVLMAVVYGVEGGPVDETHINLIDAFEASIAKSLESTDIHGLDCRVQINVQVIGPAIAAARARVATGLAKPCVLDCLVAAGELTIDELTTEGFHMLFAGFGGLSTLATNMITALAVFPDTRAKMFATRTELLAAYPVADDRWVHVDDVAYLNHFVLEVKRFFVAGPTETLGKAAQDIKVTTTNNASDVTLKIPKGTLILAGLGVTNKDPSVWPEPTKFNPDRFDQFDREKNQFTFCPHSIGATNQRRCAGEELSTVVLTAILVSSFDYEWQMVSNQDFTLDYTSLTPVPRGQLIATGFQPTKDAQVPTDTWSFWSL